MPRYILSHRRAGKFRTEEKQRSRASLDRAFVRHFAPVASVLADTQPAADTARRTIHLEAEAADIAATRASLAEDVLIEPEILHEPTWTYPLAIENLLKEEPRQQGSRARPVSFLELPVQIQTASLPAAAAASLRVTVTSQGRAVPLAKLTLILRGAGTGRTVQTAVTDVQGRGSFSFGVEWQPLALIVEPWGNFWSQVVRGPAANLHIDLPPLPQTGPSGWWHRVCRADGAFDPARGAGIRLGVVDTGAGPHPSLAHATSVGSFLVGVHDPAGGADIDQHGTHVCGLIGARPTQPGEFAGLAPGASLFAARVFGHEGGANQGDIADAIDHLSRQESVDIINLSLGSRVPSAILQDAIRDAGERGTICLCASGNDGAAVSYPAKFPESVAVGAIGLEGWGAPGSPTAGNYPSDPAKLGREQLFLTEFSNFGNEIACVAPGNGIVSTVPAAPGYPRPHAAFDGTSMASPVAAGVLAGLLAASPEYRALPRAITRAEQARETLRRACRDLSLAEMYQGRGVISW